MNELNNSAIDITYTVVTDRLRRRVVAAQLNENSEEGLKALIQFVTYLGNNIFYGAMASSTDIRFLWEDIRTRGETVTGFLSDVGSEIFFRVGHANMEIVISELAQSMSQFLPISSGNIRFSQIDDEVKNRSINSEGWRELLASNPWLTTMVLIEKAQISYDDLMHLNDTPAE